MEGTKAGSCTWQCLWDVRLIVDTRDDHREQHQLGRFGDVRKYLDVPTLDLEAES